MTDDPYSIPPFVGPTGGISSSTRTPQARPGSTHDITLWNLAEQLDRVADHFASAYLRQCASYLRALAEAEKSAVGHG